MSRFAQRRFWLWFSCAKVLSFIVLEQERGSEVRAVDGQKRGRGKKSKKLLPEDVRELVTSAENKRTTGGGATPSTQEPGQHPKPNATVQQGRNTDHGGAKTSSPESDSAAGAPARAAAAAAQSYIAHMSFLQPETFAKHTHFALVPLAADFEANPDPASISRFVTAPSDSVDYKISHYTSRDFVTSMIASSSPPPSTIPPRERKPSSGGATSKWKPAARSAVVTDTVEDRKFVRLPYWWAPTMIPFDYHYSTPEGGAEDRSHGSLSAHEQEGFLSCEAEGGEDGTNASFGSAPETFTTPTSPPEEDTDIMLELVSLKGKLARQLSVSSATTTSAASSCGGGAGGSSVVDSSSYVGTPGGSSGTGTASESPTSCIWPTPTSVAANPTTRTSGRDRGEGERTHEPHQRHLLPTLTGVVNTTSRCVSPVAETSANLLKVEQNAVVPVYAIYAELDRDPHHQLSKKSGQRLITEDVGAPGAGAERRESETDSSTLEKEHEEQKGFLYIYDDKLGRMTQLLLDMRSFSCETSFETAAENAEALVNFAKTRCAPGTTRLFGAANGRRRLFGFSAAAMFGSASLMLLAQSLMEIMASPGEADKEIMWPFEEKYNGHALPEVWRLRGHDGEVLHLLQKMRVLLPYFENQDDCLRQPTDALACRGGGALRDRAPDVGGGRGGRGDDQTGAPAFTGAAESEVAQTRSFLKNRDPIQFFQAASKISKLALSWRRNEQLVTATAVQQPPQPGNSNKIITNTKPETATAATVGCSGRVGAPGDDIDKTQSVHHLEGGTTPQSQYCQPVQPSPGAPAIPIVQQEQVQHQLNHMMPAGLDRCWPTAACGHDQDPAEDRAAQSRQPSGDSRPVENSRPLYLSARQRQQPAGAGTVAAAQRDREQEKQTITPQTITSCSSAGSTTGVLGYGLLRRKTSDSGHLHGRGGRLPSCQEEEEVDEFSGRESAGGLRPGRSGASSMKVEDDNSRVSLNKEQTAEGRRRATRHTVDVVVLLEVDGNHFSAHRLRNLPEKTQVCKFSEMISPPGGTIFPLNDYAGGASSRSCTAPEPFAATALTTAKEQAEINYPPGNLRPALEWVPRAKCVRGMKTVLQGHETLGQLLALDGHPDKITFKLKHRSPPVASENGSSISTTAGGSTFGEHDIDPERRSCSETPEKKRLAQQIKNAEDENMAAESMLQKAQALDSSFGSDPRSCQHLPTQAIDVREKVYGHGQQETEFYGHAAVPHHRIFTDAPIPTVPADSEMQNNKITISIASAGGGRGAEASEEWFSCQERLNMQGPVARVGGLLAAAAGRSAGAGARRQRANFRHWGRSEKESVKTTSDHWGRSEKESVMNSDSSRPRACYHEMTKGGEKGKGFLAAAGSPRSGRAQESTEQEILAPGGPRPRPINTKVPPTDELHVHRYPGVHLGDDVYSATLPQEQQYGYNGENQGAGLVFGGVRIPLPHRADQYGCPPRYVPQMMHAPTTSTASEPPAGDSVSAPSWAGGNCWEAEASSLFGPSLQSAYAGMIASTSSSNGFENHEHCRNSSMHTHYLQNSPGASGRTTEHEKWNADAEQQRHADGTPNNDRRWGSSSWESWSSTMEPAAGGEPQQASLSPYFSPGALGAVGMIDATTGSVVPMTVVAFAPPPAPAGVIATPGAVAGFGLDAESGVVPPVDMPGGSLYFSSAHQQPPWMDSCSSTTDLQQEQQQMQHMAPTMWATGNNCSGFIGGASNASQVWDCSSPSSCCWELWMNQQHQQQTVAMQPTWGAAPPPPAVLQQLIGNPPFSPLAARSNTTEGEKLDWKARMQEVASATGDESRHICEENKRRDATPPVGTFSDQSQSDVFAHMDLASLDAGFGRHATAP